MPVELPVGLIQNKTQDPITGNRESEFTYELLGVQNRFRADLDGVEGGSVDWTANAAVKGGGRLQVVDTGAAIDWHDARVKITAHVVGLEPFAVGVFCCSAPVEQWADEGRSWNVELLDVLTVLQEQQARQSYSLPAGTNVLAAVRDLIEFCGELAGAIDTGTETLSNPLTWVPGTSILTIINDLLDAAGYMSLWSDGDGNYRVTKYVAPASRSIVWELLDGEQSIYSPSFTRDQDLYAVPNEFIATTQGDADTAGMVSIATNDDPESPFSTVSRGRTISATEQTDSINQAELDIFARRRLNELTSPTATVAVSHALVPDWRVNDAVLLRNVPAGIDHRHVITKTTVQLDPTALSRSELREVVDL